jgi:hypothetical protein
LARTSSSAERTALLRCLPDNEHGISSREAGLSLEEPAPLTDDDVLALVTRAFQDVARPEHFTNHTHCDECWEHDDLLRDRDLTTLDIRDVGSQAWNPITMATPHGFAYYFPALVRLALAPQPEKLDWYGYTILFELRWDGPRNKRWQYFSANQRTAVSLFLEHLYRTRLKDIASYDCEYELLETLDIWSERP